MSESTAAIKTPAFSTLLMLISFASVCGVLFTPALPEMGKFFHVSDGIAQLTITVYLLGYAVGQLVYAPFANRFGRRAAILGGIGLEIASALLCALTALGGSFELLVIGRFLMAIGAAVGLSMSFAMLAESYAPARALKMMSYLALAFAVMPYIAVAIGGSLVTYFSWVSAFYFLAFYGVLLFYFCAKLPESHHPRDPRALEVRYLVRGYWTEFKNPRVVCYAIIGGCNTIMIYGFASVAPFIAMNILKMSPATYGIFNLVPGLGMVIGALISAYLAKKLAGERLVFWGTVMATPGLIAIPVTWLMMGALNPWTLFLPMLIVFIGGTLIFSAVPSLSAVGSQNRVNTSSTFSFINVMTAVIAVLFLNIFDQNLLFDFPILVTLVFVALWGLYVWSRRFAS